MRAKAIRASINKRKIVKAIRFAVVRGLLLCAIALPILILFKLAALSAGWWWVFIPLWIPVWIILAILAGFAVMSAVIAAAAIFAELSEKY